MMITRLPQAVLTGLALLFLVSCASTESPIASTETPATSAAPSATASPATGLAEPRVIELELTSALQIAQAGQRLADISVTPGETIQFVITNTAGFDHDFFIGTDEQLASGQIETLAGLPTWSSDTPQAFDWTVPEDPANLKFGCTLRGHYPSMQGTFSVAD